MYLSMPQSGHQQGASLRFGASIEAVQFAGDRRQGFVGEIEARQQRLIVSLQKLFNHRSTPGISGNFTSSCIGIARRQHIFYLTLSAWNARVQCPPLPSALRAKAQHMVHI